MRLAHGQSYRVYHSFAAIASNLSVTRLSTGKMTVERRSSRKELRVKRRRKSIRHKLAENTRSDIALILCTSQRTHLAVYLEAHRSSEARSWVCRHLFLQIDSLNCRKRNGQTVLKSIISQPITLFCIQNVCRGNQHQLNLYSKLAENAAWKKTLNIHTFLEYRIAKKN